MQIRSNSGYVLLFSLFFAAALALLTLSSGKSIRSQFKVSQLEIEGVKAEMGAESAMNWALRQLDLDPAWDGMGAGEFIEFEGTMFTSRVLSREAAPSGGETVKIEVAGSHGEALFRLQTEVSVDPGNSLSEKALMLFGGRNVDMGDTVINGDMMIVDKVGMARDWVPDLSEPGKGTWASGRPEQIDSILFPNFMVNGGIVEKFSDTVYTGDPDKEQVITSPVHAPVWSLEEYIVPGPGKVILDYTGSSGDALLEDAVYEETVVVRLNPGQFFMIKNCRLNGGIVVYAEQSWDLRNTRNDILVKHPPSTFGGGAGGVYEHIGFISPAASVKIDCSHGQLFTGFNYWGSSAAISSSKSYFTMNGLWVIHNDAHVRGGVMTKNPAVAQNLPAGFKLLDTSARLEVVSVQEAFDELPGSLTGSTSVPY